MKLDDQMYDEIFAEDDAEERIEINKSVVATTIFDWVGSLFAALVCVLLLMTAVFRVIDVDGTSMEPTLINTDKVVVTDLFYVPHDGDVIVISHGEEYEHPLVKRVIATAGQTLKIDFKKQEIFVDGEKLTETYTQGETVPGDILSAGYTECEVNRGDFEVSLVVPEGKVFVMGDNRGVSLDSRYSEVGLVDIDWIIGKAQFIVIPHEYKSTSSGMKPVFDITKIRYIYS